VHPREPDVILATVSEGPHGDNVHGELWRSSDAGRTWQHCTDGFPASTEANIDTFHVIFDEHGTAWAVVGSDLYASDDDGATWRTHWTAPSAIGVLSSRSGQSGE
jgi:photosystem II stability/assembly factor-like uncharacterized protein